MHFTSLILHFLCITHVQQKRLTSAESALTKCFMNIHDGWSLNCIEKIAAMCRAGIWHLTVYYQYTAVLCYGCFSIRSASLSRRRCRCRFASWHWRPIIVRAGVAAVHSMLHADRVYLWRLLIHITWPRRCRRRSNNSTPCNTRRFSPMMHGFQHYVSVIRIRFRNPCTHHGPNRNWKNRIRSYSNGWTET